MHNKTGIMRLNYRIETSRIAPFAYKTPLVEINSDGELIVKESRKKSLKTFKSITFLNLVGRDESGALQTYKPIDHVNRFLMAHHLDDDKLESEQYSKGLVHFFEYLLSAQAMWDKEFDDDLYEEGIDEPRPEWDVFPRIKSQRLTYRYRAALFDSVVNEPNPNLRLARTTATAYMNAVVKFYSYHLRHNHSFNNPPFEHEVITLHFEANSTSMKPYLSKEIHTTDLRLKFPKHRKNDGGVLENYTRDLVPLSNKEWSQVERILTETKQVLKNINGEVRLASLAEEYHLMFMVCRFAGLRREEVASLHRGQIFKPDTYIDESGNTIFTKPMQKLGVGSEYGSITKTKGIGNKSRVTIIPSSLMLKLYEFSISDRYQKRLNKLKKFCLDSKQVGDLSYFEGDDAIDDTKEYLFLNNKGIPFFRRLNDLNCRWSEIRNTANANLKHKMTGSIHNLRSTFAVNLFRLLLRKMSTDTALAHVSSVLGHEDVKTTLEYLKIAENTPTGDEIYEDVLDWLGAFDELESFNGAVAPKM